MRLAISSISFAIPDHRFWLYILPLTLLIILVNISIGRAQSSVGQVAIEEGGRLWIEGTAGPVDFRCRARSLSGQGQINNSTNPQASVQQEGEVNISVSLPVKSLDCGKKAMNNDMYEALRSEQYPEISYRLIEASLAEESADSTDWMVIQTRGVMEIGGVSDTTSVTVRGKISDDNRRFRVKGKKDIHMDSYDIDPPSKMLGLIRVDKNLSIYFDVTVILQQQQEVSY